MMYLLLLIVSMWSERFFDYIVVTSDELGLSANSQDISVFSWSAGKYHLLPFQIDEVEYEKGKKVYKVGDGFYEGKDELVFPARYCGDKVKLEDVSGNFSLLFEVELYDSTSTKYCYVGVGKNKPGAEFKRLPSENIRVFRKEKENEVVVVQDDRYSVFDDSRPVVKSVIIKRGDEFKEVFFGLKVDMYIELLNLIKLRKTEQDFFAKPIFIKSGDVRAIRAIRPYADIGFGIKIPGADTISYIYKGFMYVENAVPIPFNLKHLSRKAYANIYLVFSRPKRFISERNQIDLGDEITTASEEGHMWGAVESSFWSAAYFIKEISPIPISRSLYYKDERNILYVGISLDILRLPKGEHKFALYGFFMPPGNLEQAKRTVFDPVKFNIKRLI